jgi:hypothetical protein
VTLEAIVAVITAKLIMRTRCVLMKKGKPTAQTELPWWCGTNAGLTYVEFILARFFIHHEY